MAWARPAASGSVGKKRSIQEIHSALGQQVDLPAVKGSGLLLGQGALSRIGISIAAHHTAYPSRAAAFLQNPAKERNTLQEQFLTQALLCHPASVGSPGGRGSQEGEAMAVGNPGVFQP